MSEVPLYPQTPNVWAGPTPDPNAKAYLRRINSCSTQLEAQGPFRSRNESKDEEEEDLALPDERFTRHNTPGSGTNLSTLERKRALVNHFGKLQTNRSRCKPLS